MTLAGRLRIPAPPNVRPGLIILLLVVALAALAWPFLRGTAPTGLDPSWRMGLHLAAQVPLRQGVDIVWTYGPLGFLAVPTPYLGPTTLLAILASFAIYCGLVAVLLIGARRILPLWAAALLSLVVARLLIVLPPWEVLQAVVFVLAVEVITQRAPRHGLLIAAAFGLLAAVAVLGKLNTGVFIAVMAAIAVGASARPAWRGLVVFGGTAVASTLGLWLLTGQRLTDLGAYAWNAYQTVTGYSAAMDTDRTTGQAWDYVTFVAILALTIWLAAQNRSEWTTRQRIALVAVGAVLGFALWKITFTRWYPIYMLATFVIVLFPFARPAVGRRVWSVSLLAVVLAFTGVSHPAPSQLVGGVARSVASLVTEVRDATLPWLASAATDRTRADLQAAYRLSPAILSALDGHRVHIDPWESGVTVAYPSITWAPLPVFQSYAAYTPVLDGLDADRLRSDQAPDRILRRSLASTDPPDYVRTQIGRPLRPGEAFPTTVDGRFRWFEAPAAMLETFCRYRQVASDADWQVLARTTASCGAAEPIATVTAARGVAVPIPATTPGTFTIVRIHGLEASPIQAIRTALWKAPEWYVTVDDTRYRLIAATAPDGLLLAVPSSVDGSAPFAFGPPVRSMAVSMGLSRDQSADPVRYEFLRVPLVAAP